MKNLRYWDLFAIAAISWLAVTLWMAPAMNAKDVFIFRDAGWNLAASGRFESAALVYMRDLTPRLFSHYTPMMPLLFAGYCKVLPRNAYAGTVFNLLLAFLAAAVALRWVLRQPESWLRHLTAIAIAILPLAFTTYDRPEALALVLFLAVIGAAMAPKFNPSVVGLLIALTFLAHPFAAVVAALWASALALSRNWNGTQRWGVTLRQIAMMGMVAILLLLPVALLFHSLDHDSLRRFAVHALGIHSGMGVATHLGFFPALHHAALEGGISGTIAYILSMLSCPLLLAWAIGKRKQMRVQQWIAIAAGVLCLGISTLLFTNQGFYILFLAFALPMALLIVDQAGKHLAKPGLALLLFALVIHLPDVSVGVLQGIERRASYQAAKEQPDYLLANLPSPEAIVAVEGGSYDLYKPKFHHLIELDEVKDADHYAKLAGIANCYGSFHGADDAVPPLPAVLDASEFHLIQAAPEHMWVTLLGHRIMHAQWGYGCDLYLRNHAIAFGSSSHS